MNHFAIKLLHPFTHFCLTILLVYNNMYVHVHAVYTLYMCGLYMVVYVCVPISCDLHHPLGDQSWIHPSPQEELNLHSRCDALHQLVEGNSSALKAMVQSLDLKTLAVHRGALAVSSMQNGPLAFFEPSRCWRTSLAWLRWFSALGPGIPPRSDMKHLTWLLVWSPYLENRVKCRNYFHKDDKLKMYKQDSITQLYIHVAHEKRKSGTVASAT